MFSAPFGYRCFLIRNLLSRLIPSHATRVELETTRTPCFRLYVDDGNLIQSELDEMDQRVSPMFISACRVVIDGRFLFGLFRRVSRRIKNEGCIAEITAVPNEPKMELQLGRLGWKNPLRNSGGYTLERSPDNHEMHTKVGMRFSQIETTRADLGDLNRYAATESSPHMAKKKAKRPAASPTFDSLLKSAPDAANHFKSEIDHLLASVPSSVWDDDSICGLMYDFLPWHDFSSIAIQTRVDDRFDPAAWTYYDCASSDCTRIEAEIDLYKTRGHKVTLHWLLMQAAEGLLAVDFSPYIESPTVEDGFLYGPFQLQVYDPDESFRFNYCEHVLARRMR